MRLILLSLTIIFGLGCGSSKKMSANAGALNGTWVPVQQEIGGNTLPAAAFQKQRLIIKDSTYTVIAESVDKGVVKYTGNKMDIYGKEGVNTGKHFTALYKLENGQLTVCYNLAGNGYPEVFETKGKVLYFFSVFKKE